MEKRTKISAHPQYVGGWQVTGKKHEAGKGEGNIRSGEFGAFDVTRECLPGKVTEKRGMWPPGGQAF